MSENLIELASKYGTDKLKHGYIPFYLETLPKSPKKLLEIGVKEGASIRMWKDFFPDCEIHGLDLFEEFPIPEIENVIFHKGNQCDWRLFERLRNENFDIIIDDGSHNARDQMISFFGLFHKDCSYYIEDLQCNDENFYSLGLPYVARPKSLFYWLDSRYNLLCSFNEDLKIVKLYIRE